MSRRSIVFLAALCLASLFPIQSAQARYFWFFSEAPKFQSLTIALVPEKKDLFDVTKLVGRTLIFTNEDNTVDNVEIEIKPEYLYHDTQIRILVPRMVQAEYKVSITDMGEKDQIQPKSVRIKDKTHELILIYKVPDPHAGGGH